MKSNSNLRITGFTVDPTSQEITSLEVNGTPVSSSADLDDNKTATINVSTYSTPVEVTPTEGKEGMKKATITLSNIPSGTLYAWKQVGDPSAEGSIFIYTKDESPVVGDHTLKGIDTGTDSYISYVSAITEIGEDSIVVESYTYTRYSSNDIVL